MLLQGLMKPNMTESSMNSQPKLGKQGTYRRFQSWETQLHVQLPCPAAPELSSRKMSISIRVKSLEGLLRCWSSFFVHPWNIWKSILKLFYIDKWSHIITPTSFTFVCWLASSCVATLYNGWMPNKVEGLPGSSWFVSSLISRPGNYEVHLNSEF